MRVMFRRPPLVPSPGDLPYIIPLDAIRYNLPQGYQTGRDDISVAQPRGPVG